MSTIRAGWTNRERVCKFSGLMAAVLMEPSRRKSWPERFGARRSHARQCAWGDQKLANCLWVQFEARFRHHTELVEKGIYRLAAVCTPGDSIRLIGVQVARHIRTYKTFISSPEPRDLSLPRSCMTEMTYCTLCNRRFWRSELDTRHTRRPKHTR